MKDRFPGIPRGGRVNIRVKAMNDGNAELLGWMLAPTDPRDFSVKFKNTIDGKDMKELKGTGCYCVKYKEYWADGEEHYEDIEIVCQKLENAPGNRRLSERRAMLAATHQVNVTLETISSVTFIGKNALKMVCNSINFMELFAD